MYVSIYKYKYICSNVTWFNLSCSKNVYNLNFSLTRQLVYCTTYTTFINLLMKNNTALLSLAELYFNLSPSINIFLSILSFIVILYHFAHQSKVGLRIFILNDWDRINDLHPICFPNILYTTLNLRFTLPENWFLWNIILMKIFWLHFYFHSYKISNLGKGNEIKEIGWLLWFRTGNCTFTYNSVVLYTCLT